MKNYIQFSILLFITCCWMACSNVERWVELPIEEEEKLGELIVTNMLGDSIDEHLCKDTTMNNVINQITERLLKSIETNYHYKFRLLESEEVNAFTLPGANIHIYSGLVKFCETPEQVAAVIAHEIGHAEKKHVTNKIIKELGIGILFSIITGGDTGMIVELIRTATSTAFDREQEKEADNYAFSLLEKSGIHPKALASFFQKMNSESNINGEAIELFLTHPNNSSRIEAALAYKVNQGFKEELFVIKMPTSK